MNINCELLNEDVRVCPLKPAWVKSCPFESLCIVKRKYRMRSSQSKKETECDVEDCSNNICNCCDNKHKIDDKGRCVTYELNKEWFLKTLSKKVKEGIKNDK